MTTALEIQTNFVNMYKEAYIGNFELVYEFCSDEFTCTNPIKSLEGLDGVISSISLQRDVFDDLQFDILFSLATEDGVALVWRMRGRHVKEAWGVPPSGRH